MHELVVRGLQPPRLVAPQIVSAALTAVVLPVFAIVAVTHGSARAFTLPPWLTRSVQRVTFDAPRKHCLDNC